MRLSSATSAPLRETVSIMSKKPRIVALCCENSGWKAAETLQRDQDVKRVTFVKVPCAGRVEAGQILKHIEDGADAVLVAACPMDNCKYLDGNRRLVRRMLVVRKALKEVGLDEHCVHVELMSSVDSHKLKDALLDLSERVREAS